MKLETEGVKGTLGGIVAVSVMNDVDSVVESLCVSDGMGVCDWSEVVVSA